MFVAIPPKERADFRVIRPIGTSQLSLLHRDHKMPKGFERVLKLNRRPTVVDGILRPCFYELPLYLALKHANKLLEPNYQVIVSTKYGINLGGRV